MLGPFSYLKSSKLSYIGLPASLLLVAIIASYTILGSDTRTKDEQTPLGEGQELVSVQKRTFIKVVPVKGSLVFPNTAELTFDTQGNVGEILVHAGQRVVKGQLLAKLDRIAVANLREGVARAQFNLDQAQDALERAKEEFITTPLERAEFEAEIAQGRRSLEDAEEKLADFQRDYQEDLADAGKLKADSEAALDDAREKLADFQRDTNKNLADALKTKVVADLAMDRAADRLGFYQRDQDQELAKARKKLSEAEDALDKAQEALADFDGDYAATLDDARLEVADAEKALEVAEDTLTDFITGLGTIRAFDEDAVEELRRLQTAVREADTNLVQANTELVDLEGNRSLRLQDRRAAVAAAQANLAVARDLVEELESESDQLLEFQLRQAAAVVAQANLDQAQKDLEEELTGPDPLVLGKLEAAVEALQAELAQAEFDLAKEIGGPDMAELALRQKELAKRREELTELINGPDPFDVAVKEAAVASAQAQVDDALEELAGATVRAPFDGIIRLINVDIDDMVDDESRVIEIVEPTAIQVNGFVDAADIQFVRKGSVAQVTIDALPGQVWEVTVSSVAAEPRTERGVVRYPITIRFEPPEGVEVPVGLSGVSSVVLYEEEGVPSVPRGALHRTSKQTMVRVMTDGVVEERAVIPGDVDGSWVAVLEGLEEGDQVVVDTAQVASTRAGLR